VVMACYTADRLDSIRAALASLERQTLKPRQVVIAADNNDPLAEYLTEEFPWITVVVNHGERGASSTRNRGVEAVDTDLVAFLDDDETAEPDWLREVIGPLSDLEVVGTGGRCVAAWPGGKPSWFPDEFAWVVGLSYEGMPTSTAPVRNVWAGNMAVRTEAFRAVGGFRTDFGKRGSSSEPEDTDLCIRMAAATNGRWMYVPTATINHLIPRSRTSLQFFISRCFSEGRGKAALARQIDSVSVIDTERDYVRSTARAALARFGSLRLTAGIQAIMMLIGLASAACGYLSRSDYLPPHVANLARGQTPVWPSDSMKPALVEDYEISTPLRTFIDNLPDRSEFRQVWVLLRASGTPVALVQSSPSDKDIEEKIRHTLQSELGEVITDITGRGRAAHDPASAGSLPSITVAICTRDRPDSLSRALNSLELQTHRDFKVLVVDNAPTSAATAEMVRRFQDRLASLRYVVEPAAGLSRARNCALGQIDTDVVAWIDDDETADEHWLATIVAAFAAHPDAAAVSGSVVPAELETWPQWWFEQYGGHTKGRGFTPVVFQDGETHGQSPLYPVPPFGTGANMAFRVAALAEVGGFDNALGAGTVTFGGEESLVFAKLLLARNTVIYQPAALTRHFHRHTQSALEQQMFGYGVALTAFYAALLHWNWRLIGPLLRLLPGAIADLGGRDNSPLTAGLPDEFPRRLVWLKRRGMLSGPAAYRRALSVARRAGHAQ
jgi:GT2 family glycosyltransferase